MRRRKSEVLLKSSVLIVIELIFSIIMGVAQSDNAISGNQSYNIRVVLDHIFISKNDNSMGISEIVVFSLKAYR